MHHSKTWTYLQWTNALAIAPYIFDRLVEEGTEDEWSMQGHNNLKRCIWADVGELAESWSKLDFREYSA